MTIDELVALEKDSRKTPKAAYNWGRVFAQYSAEFANLAKAVQNVEEHVGSDEQLDAVVIAQTAAYDALAAALKNYKMKELPSDY